MSDVAVDRNGENLVVGQKVKVHQDDGVTEGIVKEILLDSPTENEPGFWIDIDRGEGLEGMPSYLLEVVL